MEHAWNSDSLACLAFYAILFSRTFVSMSTVLFWCFVIYRKIYCSTFDFSSPPSPPSYLFFNSSVAWKRSKTLQSSSDGWKGENEILIGKAKVQENARRQKLYHDIVCSGKSAWRRTTKLELFSSFSFWYPRIWTRLKRVDCTDFLFVWVCVLGECSNHETM